MFTSWWKQCPYECAKACRILMHFEYKLYQLVFFSCITEYRKMMFLSI